MEEFVILINSTDQGEVALINKTRKEVVMAGDDYHHKINYRIGGFLDGLDYCRFNYDMLEKQIINPSQGMFKECGFCDETEI